MYPDYMYSKSGHTVNATLYSYLFYLFLELILGPADAYTANFGNVTFSVFWPFVNIGFVYSEG